MSQKLPSNTRDATFDLIITMPSLVTPGETTQRVHHRISMTVLILLLKEAFQRKTTAPVHIECVQLDSDGDRVVEIMERDMSGYRNRMAIRSVS